MENAVDALKIAFAVFVFVMALSLTMFMFTQAKTTADIVLQSSDVTKYTKFTEANEISDNVVIDDDRVVGLETIIPTLYKYYKENYTVIFLKQGEAGEVEPLEIYETQTEPSLWSEGYINKYYTSKTDKSKICSFDVDEETRRHEPWTGDNDRIKENIDHFLQGGKYTFNVSSSYYINGQITYDYGKGFIHDYQDKKFRESIGYYTYNDVTSQTNENDETVSGITNVKPKVKRVIVYTLLNNINQDNNS